MNKSSISAKSAVAALLLSAFFYLYGCDITDPLDGIKVILDTKERETTVSVIFRDASSNRPIGFSDNQIVNITLTGPDGSEVIDLLNRERNSFESRRGFVSFAIRDGRTPTVDNPVELIAQISTQSGDFLATSQRFFVNTVGSNAFEVSLVNKQALPQGVNGGTATQLTSVTTSNGTATDVVLNRDQLGGQTPLQLSIPAGTRFFNAQGTALSGELSAEAFHFNIKEREAIQSFPGGLSGVVSNIEDLASLGGSILNTLQTEDSTVFFTPAGLISMSLTVGGQQVRNADGTMEFCIGLPDGILNRSGDRVAVGSSVPIWSYDRGIGEWTFEFEAEVQETPTADPIFDNTISPTFVCGTTNHFSFWTVGDASPVCRTGATVNLRGLQMPVVGRLVRADSEEDFFMGIFPSEIAENGDRFIDLTNVPTDIPGRLQILDLLGNLVTTVEIPQLCDRGPVTVDLSGAEETVLTFRGTGVCPDGDVEIRPNVPLLISPDEASGVWMLAGTTQKGSLTFGIPKPGSYLFGIYFENRWYQYEVDLSSFRDGDVYEETIELPDNICREL